MMGIVVSETCGVAGCSLQPGHYSSLSAPNLQPTANQERKDQYGNEHYCRELQAPGCRLKPAAWTQLQSIRT